MINKFIAIYKHGKSFGTLVNHGEIRYPQMANPKPTRILKENVRPLVHALNAPATHHQVQTPPQNETKSKMKNCTFILEQKKKLCK